MERQKAEKEKEISRLRAQQERAKDKQAERVSSHRLHIVLLYTVVCAKRA